MVRRRRPAGDVAREGVPAALLRFRYEDWADEEADGPPPEHFRGDEAAWVGVRAWERFAAARREYRRTHGISWAEWRAIEAAHGVGVVVDRAAVLAGRGPLLWEEP